MSELFLGVVIDIILHEHVVAIDHVHDLCPILVFHEESAPREGRESILVTRCIDPLAVKHLIWL